MRKNSKVKKFHYKMTVVNLIIVQTVAQQLKNNLCDFKLELNHENTILHSLQLHISSIRIHLKHEIRNNWLIPEDHESEICNIGIFAARQRISAMLKNQNRE